MEGTSPTPTCSNISSFSFPREPGSRHRFSLKLPVPQPGHLSLSPETSPYGARSVIFNVILYLHLPLVLLSQDPAKHLCNRPPFPKYLEGMFPPDQVFCPNREKGDVHRLLLSAFPRGPLCGTGRNNCDSIPLLGGTGLKHFSSKQLWELEQKLFSPAPLKKLSW